MLVPLDFFVATLEPFLCINNAAVCPWLLAPDSHSARLLCKSKHSAGLKLWWEPYWAVNVVDERPISGGGSIPKLWRRLRLQLLLLLLLVRAKTASSLSRRFSRSYYDATIRTRNTMSAEELSALFSWVKVGTINFLVYNLPDYFTTTGLWLHVKL
jgi:hypothetical protein